MSGMFRTNSRSAFKRRRAGPGMVERAMSSRETSRSDFPFRKQRLEVLGANMAYVDEGAGAPILFLHGNPTSSYLWRNVIPHVLPVGRCLAPDLMGMGDSDKRRGGYVFQDHARYLQAFIENLKLEHVVLVVHDWGSALGFDWAMSHEANVRGLVFMEAIITPVPSWELLPPEARQLFQALRTSGVGEKLIFEENVFIEQLLPSSVVRQLSSEEMAAYRAPFLKPETRGSHRQSVARLTPAGQPAPPVSSRESPAVASVFPREGASRADSTAVDARTRRMRRYETAARRGNHVRFAGRAGLLDGRRGCAPLYFRRADITGVSGNAFNETLELLLVGRSESRLRRTAELAERASSMDGNVEDEHVRELLDSSELATIIVEYVLEGMHGYATMHHSRPAPPTTVDACSIVAADSCLGRVGYVCTGFSFEKVDGTSSPPESYVFEVELDPRKRSYELFAGIANEIE